MVKGVSVQDSTYMGGSGGVAGAVREEGVTLYGGYIGAPRGLFMGIEDVL